MGEVPCGAPGRRCNVALGHVALALVDNRFQSLILRAVLDERRRELRPAGQVVTACAMCHKPTVARRAQKKHIWPPSHGRSSGSRPNGIGTACEGSGHGMQGSPESPLRALSKAASHALSGRRSAEATRRPTASANASARHCEKKIKEDVIIILP